MDQGTMDYLAQTPIYSAEVSEILGISEYHQKLLILSGTLETSVESQRPHMKNDHTNVYDVVICAIRERYPKRNIEGYLKESILEELEFRKSHCFYRIAAVLAGTLHRRNCRGKEWGQPRSYQYNPTAQAIKSELIKLLECADHFLAITKEDERNIQRTCKGF